MLNFLSGHVTKLYPKEYMLISIDPAEDNPMKDDLVEFPEGHFQWKVTKVLAPNVYLRSVEGNRFAVHPISSVKLIWRDQQRKKDLDLIQYYESLM